MPLSPFLSSLVPTAPSSIGFRSRAFRVGLRKSHPRLTPRRPPKNPLLEKVEQNARREKGLPVAELVFDLREGVESEPCRSP